MYEFFGDLIQGLLDGVGTAIFWLGGLLESMFEGFKNVLIALFQPLFVLIEGLWYLLNECFTIVVLVVQVVLGLTRVISGVIAGAYNTFSQILGYSGSTSNYYMPGAYQQGWSTVVSFMDSTGINTIALIMAVFVWLATAYAVIRIAGGER